MCVKTCRNLPHVERGGATWLSFESGMARAPVTELRLHRSNRILYAATFAKTECLVCMNAVIS